MGCRGCSSHPIEDDQQSEWLEKTARFLYKNFTPFCENESFIKKLSRNVQSGSSETDMTLHCIFHTVLILPYQMERFHESNSSGTTKAVYVMGKMARTKAESSSTCCASDICISDSATTLPVHMSSTASRKVLSWVGIECNSTVFVVIIKLWKYVPCQIPTGLVSRKHSFAYVELQEGPVMLAKPRRERELKGGRVIPLVHLDWEVFATNDSFVAKIGAISPLYIIGRANSFFLLELVGLGPHSDYMVHLIVKENGVVHLHSLLEAGSVYRFWGIKASTIFKGEKRERKLFKALKNFSVAPIEAEEIEKLEENFSVMCEDGLSTESAACLKRRRLKDAPISLNERVRERSFTRTISYTGTITRTVNVECGMYELDYKLKLFVPLSIYCYHGRGLRKGSLVKIFNCIPLYALSAINTESYDRRDICGLAFCARTSIHVQKYDFGKECDFSPFYPSVSTFLPYFKSCCVQRFANVVEVYMDIVKKFKGLLTEKILKGTCLKSLLEHNERGLFHEVAKLFGLEVRHNDIYAEFFGSGKNCCLEGKCIPLPVCFPPLERIVNLSKECRKRPSDFRDEWSYEVIESDKFSNRAVLVLVTLDEKGGLIASDSSSSLSIAFDFPSPELVNSILLIKRFEVAFESWNDLVLLRSSTIMTYMRARRADCFVVVRLGAVSKRNLALNNPPCVFYISSRNSFSCNQYSHRCAHIEGCILRAGGAKHPASLALKGKASNWLSVLRAGNTYTFNGVKISKNACTSSSEEGYTCEALEGFSAELLDNPNGPKCENGEDNENVVWPISKILASLDNPDVSVHGTTNASYLTSVEGIIVERSLRYSSNSSSRSISQQAGTKNIAKEKLETSIIVLKLQNPCSPFVLDLYVSFANVSSYVKGLLPGSHIRATRILRKNSKAGKVYCLCVPSSDLEIVEAPQYSLSFIKGSSLREFQELHSIPSKYIFQLYSSFCGKTKCFFPSKQGTSQNLFQIKGHVVQVIKASFWWSCDWCGSIMFSQVCVNGCGAPSVRLARGKAKGLAKKTFFIEGHFIVDDGTAECYCFVENEAIFKIFSFTDADVQSLQNICLQRGPCHFGFEEFSKRDESKFVENETLLGRKLYDLLFKRIFLRRIFTFFCFQKSKSVTGQDPPLESRKFKSGPQVYSLHFLPKVYLRVEHIVLPPPVSDGHRLLAKVKQHMAKEPLGC
eukprot:Nk52_evm9s745 gene=Nk52_evmTU9s745